MMELNGHEDLVLDCDIDVQLGVAATCGRDTTVKVSREMAISWNLLLCHLLLRNLSALHMK